uniref:Glycosyltransferases n=1 Tax=Aegilops tauschii subsp. strangulata TaxID=200361 RepID=A0A453AJ41_AEGTS
GAVARGGAGGGRAAHGAPAARRRGGVPAPGLPGELHGRRRRHGEGAAPPAEPGAGARGGAPARRCRALRRPRRRLRPPLLRPAQADQDSVKFVQRLAAEDYNKSRGMPNRDCSEIMVWRGDQFVAT